MNEQSDYSMTPAQRVDVLRAACCITAADGETTEDERKVLDTLADEIGVGLASLNAMIQRAHDDPDFYQQQFRILKDAPLECLRILFGVTAANGSIKREEFAVLQKLSERLDLGAEEFKKAAQEFVSSQDGT